MHYIDVFFGFQKINPFLYSKIQQFCKKYEFIKTNGNGIQLNFVDNYGC